MRLIDADKLRDGIFHRCVTGLTEREMGYQAGWNDALMYEVADAPTVDAVEVVRCKDCRFFHKYAFMRDYTECTHFDCDVTEDGYCWWGERREDEID